ncbi:MAG: 30S ribosomal protein S2 [Dehalococcoidia bacterium]|nr:30S ribosomal protein S2 [Dehalococcoidia bacterium]
MKALLEAGVHFGHQTRRWDPRMRRFIFTERNGIHILDLQQTVGRLQAAMDFARDTAADGGLVLFVGTKKQAVETIEQEATRAGMPYVTNRWLGGTLTNFNTIQSRIDHLARLENQKSRGEFERLIKKEALLLDEEIVRLNRFFGGIKEMQRPPAALYVVDCVKEHIAIAEALRLGIPIVAMVDTNCNPDEIDYPVPSNDDAIRAIKLITARIADAIVEGTRMREFAEEAGLEAEDMTLEEYAEGYSASPDDSGPETPPAEGEAPAEAEAPLDPAEELARTRAELARARAELARAKHEAAQVVGGQGDTTTTTSDQETSVGSNN